MTIKPQWHAITFIFYHKSVHRLGAAAYGAAGYWLRHLGWDVSCIWVARGWLA